MKWYAAHIILYFKLRNRKQSHFRVWENIVLVRARDADEAYEKAEARGRDDAIEDETLTWGGHPAKIVFAGVRKVTLCQDEDTRPTDGTEVTYTEMNLASEEAIRKLVACESVTTQIVDRFPDDEPETMPPVNGRRTPARQRVNK